MNDMVLVMSVVRIIILVFFAIPFIRWCSYVATKFCTRRFSQHIGVLAGRIILYTGLIFVGVTILHECGFNVTALLGAAGVLGVAIGFASQTSISNIISGFFLLIERSFSIGDTIKSGDITGIVESIDLLSVNVRTLDNKLVRLPNELVLKQCVTNLTYYPIKRIDCILTVPYTDDAESLKQQIRDVVKNNTLFLHEPVCVVMMNRVGQLDYDTEIRQFFTVRVWVAKENFSLAPAVLMQQLKEWFDKNKQKITITHIN